MTVMRPRSIATMAADSFGAEQRRVELLEALSGGHEEVGASGELESFRGGRVRR
jgi:hypothetical protein